MSSSPATASVFVSLVSMQKIVSKVEFCPDRKDIFFCIYTSYVALRQLSESLILIGSAMFGATFNQVTRVGLIFFGTPKDGSLEINSLTINHIIVSTTETSSKMASTLCQKWF